MPKEVEKDQQPEGSEVFGVFEELILEIRRRMEADNGVEKKKEEKQE